MSLFRHAPPTTTNNIRRFSSEAARLPHGNDYLFGIDSKLYGNAGDDTLDMGCASPSNRGYGNGGPGFDIAFINAGYPFLVDVEQVGC